MKGQMLNTTEAANMLGVGNSTIKRWADEGTLPHSRTSGGHRRFLREDIELFAERSRVETGSAPEERPRTRKQRRLDDWISLLLNESDIYAIAAKMLESCARLESWAQVGMELGEVLTEVGVRWESDELSVVEEHIITERLMRAAAWCARTILLPPKPAKALLIAADGDEHTAGLALVEFVVREAGLETIWVGRGTPFSDLESWVETHPIELVAVSASCASGNPEILRRQHQRLVELTKPRDILLVVGGSGAWPASPEYGHRLHSLEALRVLLDSRG